MRVNVDKVLERDQKLSELDDRADALQAGASQFEASAGKLKRKFWWKNMKMMLIMGGVIAVVVVIFGAWIYGKVAPPPAAPAVVMPETNMFPSTSMPEKLAAEKLTTKSPRRVKSNQKHPPPVSTTTPKSKK
jgi:negative regulator of sigma E activity